MMVLVGCPIPAVKPLQPIQNRASLRWWETLLYGWNQVEDSEGMKDETADQILLSVIFDEERNGHLFHMKSGAQSRNNETSRLHKQLSQWRSVSDSPGTTAWVVDFGHRVDSQCVVHGRREVGGCDRV